MDSRNFLAISLCFFCFFPNLSLSVRGQLCLFPFEAALFLLLERGLSSEHHRFAALQFENPTGLSKDLGVSLIAAKEGNFLKAERIFLGGPESAGKFFQCAERRGRRRRRRRRRERDESVFEFGQLHQIENEAGPFLGGVFLMGYFDVMRF
ncbi:uncharacterized protein LOC107429382 [Ziziphus jujuba]|uniref:Uncharacterized protein LOC107429382 n=1 Tax=Ziziphus jujuba TaxID=326968 RepID=A0ABM3ZYB4_ZIZJJ|nr:uncharacterized protein LOC107429382 [Ziziphus jujuba]